LVVISNGFSARYYGYIRARLSFFTGAGRPSFLKLTDQQNKSYERCTDVVGDTCFLYCKEYYLEYYLQILQRKLATAIQWILANADITCLLPRIVALGCR
jgi:hypothetical protein